MTPQIDNGITTTEIQQYEQPNLTYLVSGNIISGKVDGIEALKQTIHHILVTERYAFPIYSDDYGAELEKYHASDVPTIEADIEETLRDALMQDNRVTNVYVNSVVQEAVDSCNVNFTVESIYGSFEETIDVLS